MTTKAVLATLTAMLILPPAPARAAECNGNGTPDDMEPDCNTNGMPDDCDIAGKMYWSDSGDDVIQRAYLTGARVENLVTSGLSLARGIAVDPAGGMIYWTDATFDRIQRANLDGTDVENVVTNGLSSPQGIAVDPVAGKIYWTDSGTDRIQRANLDGTNIENVVTNGLNTPQDLDLDLAAGKFYFTDFTFNHIQRANLDGTGLEHVRITGTNPYGITLDPAGGKMYWTEWGQMRVRRSNLDGTTPETIVPATEGLNRPSGIAVDPVAGKVYWTDWGTDLIQRADLTGTQIEDLPIGGLVDVYVIALALPIPDADTNGVPDECEGTPTLVGAFTSKPNVSGPDGFCDLPIDLAPGLPIASEPRVAGITEVIFVYDGPAGGTVAVESDCTCPSPPDYLPIDPPVSCVSDGDTLVCTFTPALANACTYRLTVPSAGGPASVELRGLIGDVSGDGRVNATDRSGVIGIWTGLNFTCATDLDGNGVTHAADRSTVVGYWTGGVNCAP